MMFDLFKEMSNDLLQEIKVKDKTLNNIYKYIKSFKPDEITTRELCILNDIMLILDGKEDVVKRLKEGENEKLN